MTYLPEAADAEKIRDPSVELSSNRTSLSFERTHMSADRTLMAQLRTSLSLIGFGFTLYEVFRQLAENGVLAKGDLTARRLGAGLLALGVLLLATGLVSHMRFSRQLTNRRVFLFRNGLLHHEVHYSASPTFLTAALLLVVGILTLISIGFQVLR